MVCDATIPQRIGRLTPLADVLTLIEPRVQPVAPRVVDAVRAQGCILAAPAIVREALPQQPTATADGWALRADETADASAYTPAPLAAMPILVAAGETLPAGTDAVAPLDCIVISGGQAAATTTIAPSENVLPAGGDAGPQTVLLPAGRRISVQDAAILHCANIASVEIRQPAVTLVRNFSPDDKGRSAAVADMVAGWIRGHGATVTVTDDPIDAAMRDDRAHALIVIGGTGPDGDSVTSLRKRDSTTIHGIGLSPGEAAAIGFIEGHPALALPSQPDAALCGLIALVQPVLRRLSGQIDNITELEGVLTRKVTSSIGIVTLVPVHLADGQADPLAAQYWPLHAIARANGYIVIPAGSEGFAAGTRVPVRLWS